MQAVDSTKGDQGHGHGRDATLMPQSTLRLLFTIGILLAMAPAFSSAQDATTAPPYPAVGRLIDIGGWRLHLYCTGRQRPGKATVILEAGVGDFSVEWSLVQPQVAKITRVCSYDRAGDGWSDIGPHPRTLHQIVYELHTLLNRAGERAPFVLVGHSYGGWLVRLYQSIYPAEVSGMVLVDAAEDDPLRITSEGRVVRASSLAASRSIPPVKTKGPLKLADIPAPALTQIRAGLADSAEHANEPPRDKLPQKAQRMRSWALGQVGHVIAAVNPVELEELAALRAERSATSLPLGDLPLIVITRGLPDDTGPDAAAHEQAHKDDQAALAALSRHGKRITAEHSGHHVQLDQPQLVVSAIQEVVAAARK